MTGCYVISGCTSEPSAAAMPLDRHAIQSGPAATRAAGVYEEYTRCGTTRLCRHCGGPFVTATVRNRTPVSGKPGLARRRYRCSLLGDDVLAPVADLDIAVRVPPAIRCTRRCRR